MIFAALKMKRLQAYGLAVAASILAIIISPGNLIGLPIGIWALVVLSQRDVRAAFGRKRATGSASVSPPDDMQHPDTPRPSSAGASGTPAVSALVLCLAGLPLSLLSGMLWPGVWRMVALFSLLELVALILGIVGWSRLAGKLAVAISGFLLLAVLVASPG